MVSRTEELLSTRASRLTNLLERVVAFERSSLKWHLMSPTRPADRAKDGEYLRIDTRSSALREPSFIGDIIPPSVKEKGAPQGVSEPRFQIARLVMPRDGSRAAIRWACFFEGFTEPMPETWQYSSTEI